MSPGRRPSWPEKRTTTLCNETSLDPWFTLCSSDPNETASGAEARARSRKHWLKTVVALGYAPWQQCPKAKGSGHQASSDPHSRARHSLQSRQLHFYLFYILYSHLRFRSFFKKKSIIPPPKRGFKPSVLIEICFRKDFIATKPKRALRNLPRRQGPEFHSSDPRGDPEPQELVFQNRGGLSSSDLKCLSVPRSLLRLDTKDAPAEDRRPEGQDVSKAGRGGHFGHRSGILLPKYHWHLEKRVQTCLGLLLKPHFYRICSNFWSGSSLR